MQHGFDGEEAHDQSGRSRSRGCDDVQEDQHCGIRNELSEEREGRGWDALVHATVVPGAAERGSCVVTRVLQE